MPTFTTDHLAPQDRFEYWREERARRLFGVEAEISPEWRSRFTACIAASVVGPARLLDVAVSSYEMRRTQRAIDRSPDAGFYVYHLVRGRGLAVVGDRVEHVRDGALSTGMSDVPYSNMPDPHLAVRSTLCVYRAVRIPLAALPELPAASTRLAMHQHKGNSRLDALLHSFFATFIEQAPHLTGADADVAVHTLAQLAIGARGAIDTRADCTVAAIRQGLLTRAHRLIERELHRTNLTPAQVAIQLGISVRKLHLVFEPSGESFGRHLLARRLARADRLLREALHLSVTEIAYASGFGSLSTFFRCYRAAYGVSPGEQRSGS